MERELVDYEDKEVIEFLKFGFPVRNLGQVTGGNPVSNHRSATEHPSHIDSFVNTEVKDRAVIGGFSSNPFSTPAFFSPLGSTERRDSDDRRIIMDLSFPRGGSINDMIPKDEYLGQQVWLTFPRVDELVGLVKVKGQGCKLFKKDLRRAYRQIRIDVGDAHLLGFTWRGQMFFDISLPMGLRSSALCCQRTTLAIQHIYKKRGYDLVVYLDDLGSAETPQKAEDAYKCPGDVLSKSGFEEKVSKSCPPSTCMSFLGVWFDTESLTLEVTRDRLDELLRLLDQWSHRTRASRKELQSVIGKLNFVASVVRPGRVFISRLLNHLRGLPETGAHDIPSDVHKDLMWWARFLPKYNGVSMMPLQDWCQPDSIFASDACLVGCGAWVPGLNQFFHAEFPEHIRSEARHINGLELLTIIVACKVWGRFWKGMRILVQCDNEVSVVVMNCGRTKDVFLQACLRELEFIVARHKFEIRAIHIPGVSNRLPDALSRWSLSEAHQNQFWSLMGDRQVEEIYIYEGLFSFSHDW